MPDSASIRWVAAISAALVVVRIATASVVGQPGYTDSFYFTDVAVRLAGGAGLSADFIWSPIEAHGWLLPVPSHLFWVPLPTALAAIGIALLGPALGTFRAAQLPFLLIGAALPAVTFLAARTLGSTRPTALIAGALAGLGGLFAAGLVAVDAFAPAAVLGTSFFVAYTRASAGSMRAGALAGSLVGLLYLTRTEGALFGLAFFPLLVARRTRAAGAAGALVALAIGGLWLARDVSAGLGPGVFARSALLVRYEDFFAIAPAYLEFPPVSLDRVLEPKAAALLGNAVTFAFAFGLLPLIPLAAALRVLGGRAEVRAWFGLALLVLIAQSLVWTLHSTRGSYFHSLAAFFPFGTALAAAGAERLLAARARQVAVMWTIGTAMLVAAISFAAVSEWDRAFNGGTRDREAALDAIPAGPFLAIDAAAWRWIADRPVVVTPADGLSQAACVAALTKARAIVLEAAHFTAYDQLYTDEVRPAWLDAPIVRGAIRVYAIRGVPACEHGP